MARVHAVRARGPRRKTTWFQFAPLSQVVTTGATLVFSLNAAALALRPFTFIRSYWSLYTMSDQVAADEIFGAAFGLAIVSDQASAIGVTAIPTPVTDMASDLFFGHVNMWGAVSDGGTGTGAITGVKHELDSKAMRKVDVGQDLAVVVEGYQGTVGGGTKILMAGRMLIKVN